jgi:ribosomal-protein-serine acetyltransferase
MMATQPAPLRVRLAPGVVLRPLTADDADALIAAAQCDEAHLSRWLPWTDLLRDPQQCKGQWERWLTAAPGERSHFFVLVQEAQIVGMAFVFRISTEHRRGEIGYWLARSAEGRGLMTAACRAMIDHLYASTDLDRLWIRAATGNGRSQAVARRLGFAREGVLRHDALLRGEPVDHVLYSMLREQWLSPLPPIEPYDPAPSTVTLRDGRAVAVREAEPDDAAAVLRFRASMVGDRNLGTSVGELHDTVNTQEQFLVQAHDQPRSLALLAMCTTEVVGLLTFAAGERRKLAHHGSFGVMVAPHCQGQGIGSALILRLLAWARETKGLEKVRLSVHGQNTAAQRLYERLGFVQEGRLLRNVKQDDGTYDDEVVMARFVC